MALVFFSEVTLRFMNCVCDSMYGHGFILLLIRSIDCNNLHWHGEHKKW